MRENGGMKENFRLIFSLLWFPAVGCAFASTLVFLVTFGEFSEYFFASVAALVVATVGVIVTSLD